MIAEAPAITMRPYQRRGLQSVLAARDRGIGRVLVVMATGTGKTRLFAQIINELSGEPWFQCLVIAHRQELLEQSAYSIAQQNPHLVVSIESGDRHAVEDADVVVAGVQSIGRPECRRLQWLRPTLIISDEAHHSAADSWMHAYRRYGLFDEGCEAFHVGVTATPHRLDNKPLHGHEKAIYQEVVFKFSIRDAIQDGWLCDLRGYRALADGLDLSGVKKTAGDYNQRQLQQLMNTEPRNELAFKSWCDVAKGRKTIVFCSGVDHARDVAAVFAVNGVPAETVNGEMDKEVREAIIRRFRDGTTQVLTNMDIATEGFDVPDASCVLMLRPTQSWTLYTQMVGRGTRPLAGIVDGIASAEDRRAAILSSDKPDCIVIDVVGNTEEHSLAKAPKGKTGPVDLAGLVGLPAGMDLEGHSVQEALDLWEGLDERAQALALKRCVSFRGLTSKLTEVDLLKELEVPDEVIQVSRFAWLKIGPDQYALGCGATPTEKGRRALLRSDEIGNWWVRLIWEEHRPYAGAQTMGDTVALGTDDVRQAFEMADDIVRRKFVGVDVIADQDASWKRAKPSAKQIELLRKFKVAGDVIAAIGTKGQASAMLDRLMAERGRKKR